MSISRSHASARGIFGGVLRLALTLSLVLVGSTALALGGTAQSASADPAVCNPVGNGGYMSPYPMWELAWGRSAPKSGQPVFRSADYGGLTQILWNGAHQPINGPAMWAGYWYPKIDGALDGTHMEYRFFDGTVWTADASATPDGCDLTVDWEKTNPASVTTEVCSPTLPGPIATNRDSQGWTFTETRKNGYNEFTADGLHVWNDSNTGTDKAAALKSVGTNGAGIPLQDVGVPSLNLGATSGALPSLQLVTDFDNNGTIDGILVGENVYNHAGGIEYWVPNGTASWVKAAAPSFDGPANADHAVPPKRKAGWVPSSGSDYSGTLDQWLVQFPDARVLQIGYSLGSGIKGDAVIESLDAGCLSYNFELDNDYDEPTTTIEVNDAQILPIENYLGWGDGYAHTPRSYSTATDGAHIGNGYKTQLFHTFAAPLTVTDLESLITNASVSVVSGSVTYQLAIRYGNANTFTTLRSPSLTSPDNHFSVSDKWVSTKKLVDNTLGEVTTTNYQASLADLVTFLNSQANVRVQGFGVQSEHPAIVQDIVFNGSKYQFVPTTTTPTTKGVVVPEADIQPNETAATYLQWHEGYTNTIKSFSVDVDGLNLGDPSHSMVLKGLDHPVPGGDLYGLLTSQAGVTVVDGTVTYQVAATWGASGWTTLRSASLGAGSHTFGLNDTAELWMSSQPIGGTILANTAYPLSNIIDALNGYWNAKAIAFGVQADSAAQVSGIAWGDTNYTFAPSIIAGTPTITGTMEVGEVLTATPNAASWTPNSGVGFTYQWLADGTEIPGANGPKYTLTQTELGKAISVTVTGSMTGYTPDSATSLLPLTPNVVVLAEIVAGTPTISGTSKVGEVLTVTAKAAGWTPSSGLTFTYQWKANGVDITGATAPTFTPTAAELDETISVTVTGSKTDSTPASATAIGAKVVAGDDPHASISVTRIAGADRYETAAKIAQKWPAASVVYIATGLGFADALSAGPVAAFKDAPLLLTPTDALARVAKEQLLRLTPPEIIIVGGNGAVSAAVEAELRALPFSHTVTRVGGVDRYETSRKLVVATFAPGTIATAYLADGGNFPDALTASPAAAHFGGPVVLIPGSTSKVDSTTLALLDTLGVTTVKVAGGSGVVTAAIVTQLNDEFGVSNVTRNSGSDRYATAVAVNGDEFTSATVVYLATGTGFADALAGAALAGMQGGPLFISQPTCIPQSVLDAIESLGATDLVLLGGTGVLSAEVAGLRTCG